MRRRVLVLSTILLACFWISYAKPNSTQGKTGIFGTTNEAGRRCQKESVPPTPEGLAEVRKPVWLQLRDVSRKPVTARATRSRHEARAARLA